jgi:hypothetical protein
VLGRRLPGVGDLGNLLLGAVQGGWACFGINGGEKACESLRGWAVLIGRLERGQAAILGGGSGKGLVSENAVVVQLEGPYLLRLRANFWGLVMVRSEVSKL